MTVSNARPDVSVESGPVVQTGSALGRSTWRRAFGLREMGIYYALFLLVAALSITTAYIGQANYLTIENITNVMYQTSLTGFMAIAMTVVLITGNFDLSVASVAAFSAAVLIGRADVIGFWPAVTIAMAVSMAIGLFNGMVVEFLGINAFIVTLGTMTAVRAMMLSYVDGRSIAVSSEDTVASMKAFEAQRVDIGLPLVAAGGLLLIWGLVRAARAKRLTPRIIGLGLGGLALAGFSYAGDFSIPMKLPVIYLAIFAIFLWFLLGFTTIGRRIYSVGGNPLASRLSGIRVINYKLGAFVLCSAAAGFAGVLFASRLRSINPNGLQGAELTVIAAAILGGTSLFGGAGSVVKTLAGALLLYSLTNGFNILNLGSNYRGLVEGVVVVSAAAIYTIGNRKGSRTG